MNLPLGAEVVKWLTIGLRERAIMHLMPPYNWSLRQVADDIGVEIATVHGWRKQLELEGLIIRKVEPVTTDPKLTHCAHLSAITCGKTSKENAYRKQ